MPRIKVLLCTTNLGGGGAEMHFVRMANCLDPARFEVTLAALRGGGSYARHLLRHVKYCPLRPGRGAAGRVARLLHRARAVGELIRLVRVVRPSVILSTVDAANLAAMAARSAWPRARHIVSLQAPPSALFTGGLRPLRPAIRACYRQATHLVALSEGVAQDARRFCPQVGGKLSVIHNACVDARVRVAQQEPTRPARPPGRRLLLACGRLTPQKGFDTLLEAMPRIVAQCPEALLWILGEGPLEAELKAQASRLRLDDHVAFLGFQENPFAYMRAADLFVLSSVFEGLGMVLVEAMACGTPVLSTDCPHGPAEILAGRRGGVLVPMSDSESLAVAACELLQNPERLVELSQQARVRSEAFDAYRIASQYAKLVGRVAS